MMCSCKYSRLFVHLCFCFPTPRFSFFVLLFCVKRDGGKKDNNNEKIKTNEALTRVVVWTQVRNLNGCCERTQ